MSIRSSLLRNTMRWFVLGPDNSMEKMRTGLERFGRFTRRNVADWSEVTVGGIPAVRVTPRTEPSGLHVLYLHGGAYNMGSPMSHLGLVSQIVMRLGATATVVDYRLAPEHPYPAAIDDCTAAYRALLEEVPPGSLVVAGDSAGGGATLATMVAARDAGDRLPACLYLLSPWTDLTLSGETHQTKRSVDPLIPRGGIEGHLQLMEDMIDGYRGGADAGHPGISPLFADLTGLPPILVQVGADETLLSDSTMLADRAEAVGVEVDLDVVDGMWHVWQILAPMLPESRTALDRASTFIQNRTTTESEVDASLTD
jgi:acetyl esterase/lipase|tara:strand:+ start:4089 stop:5024 length:936 start_codon:yes stop_codon:yes gene_type:complete